MDKHRARTANRTAKIMVEDMNRNDYGWALVYVQAEKPIPAMWRDDFYKELVSENLEYQKELEDSLKWFGVRFL